MSDLGTHSLRIALVLSLLGVGAGLAAGLRTRRLSGGEPDADADAWTRVAERAVLLGFAFVSLAMGALFAALAGNDFSLRYVAEHSARSMTLPYRLASLWGGQAGSLLLWVWMLLAYGAAAVLVHRRSSRHLMPWVTASLLANAIFFLVLLNFTSLPFTRLDPGEVISDGAGLNPLLQHPAMMVHPLFLYAGFTGFAVPFSFAFAALVTGRLGTAWLRVTRRWTLLPWFLLSMGILLGGRWAYEVLGWGGYWAWDPVENASLMPWLAATAYLHSVMIQEKRDMLKTWNFTLIGLTYTLCLFGTFLTRSGIVSSVHSFTSAGWFGTVFLAYVLGFAALYFGALLVRRASLASTHRLESALSREGSFVINNWLFMGVLAVVFWGTLFPVVSEAVRDVKISVGPAFFNSMSAPLALGLLLMTGVGPLIAWRKSTPASLRRQFVGPGLVALLTAGAVFGWMRGETGFYPLVTFALAAFVAATIVQEYVRAVRARRQHGESVLQALRTLMRKNQRRYGGYVVHLGIVFFFVGFAGAAFNEEKLENVSPGGSVTLGDYRLEYLTAQPLPKQHYGGAVARLALYRGDTPVALMTPERRIYWLEQQPASIPSIVSTLREDLYVILTAIEHDGSATLKVHRNPLVNWIWIGGITFVLGTALILWPHPQARADAGVA